MKKLLLSVLIGLAFVSQSFGMSVDDGKGRGFKMEVNKEQQGVVRAIIEEELEHASINGDAYAWTTGAVNVDVNDTFIFLKNTGSTPLILDRLIISGDTSATATRFDIGIGSATTTPAGGTLITGVNINHIFSSATADAVSRSDETAVADATVVLTTGALTSTMSVTDLTGIILGEGHYIQVNCETEPTLNAATIIAHYENPS